MMQSGILYAGIRAETYVTEQGDKVMGSDILTTATPDDLRKELQHYLSVDKAHRSWVTVTNITNLYQQLSGHAVLEQLTAMELTGINQVMWESQAVNARIHASTFGALVHVQPKKRRCEIL